MRLFRSVCAAVHFAHQNLVIHRDIKPGNILITTDGIPKLLDFGIAKILNPEISQTVEQTATMMRLMTPDYASPEQVRGEPVTTATDTYSLGVVLYELLTGHRPYHLTSILPSDIERTICDQEPVRPSTVVKRPEERLSSTGENIIVPVETISRSRGTQFHRLRRMLTGDLDNIVLMALRKEPQRRYASVEHFSEDIRRYLGQLPVSARPDTLIYRAGKFVKRNRIGVAASVLILLSLIGGLLTTIWQARRAQEARQRAERRLRDVRQLANLYLFEFHDAIEKLPGTTPARKLLVEHALRYLDDLASENSTDQSLQTELATAFSKVGDVQGRPGFPNLGDTGGALASYRKALSIRLALGGEIEKSPEFQRDLATNYDRIGDALRLSGDAAGALDNYRLAFGIRDSLWKKEPALALNRSDLADSYQRIADALAQTGDLTGALDNQLEAMPLFESAGSNQPADPEIQRKLFISHIKLGDKYARMSRLEDALAGYRKALAIAQPLAASDPQNARAQRELSICHEKIGNALVALKDFNGGITQYGQSLVIRQRLASVDRMNAEAQRDLSSAYTKIADIMAANNVIDGALENYRAALTIDESLSLNNSSNAQNLQDRAYSHDKIGDLLLRRRTAAGGLEQYGKAASLLQAVADLDGSDVEVRVELASILLKISRTNIDQARVSPPDRLDFFCREAIRSYRLSLDLITDLKSRHPELTGIPDPEQVKSEIAVCSRQ